MESTTGRQYPRRQLVRQAAIVLLAMNGIVAGRMTALRWLAILGSFATYYLVLVPRASLSVALAYFATATALHYGYLFAMFRPRGWSAQLRARFGDAQAYAIHEGWMAVLFCHNGLSMGYLFWATRGVPLPGVTLGGLPAPATVAAAVLLSLAGMGVKVWATLIVGVDAYYYRDLFLERSGGTFERSGPYRLLRNPMYTVGHLQAYGAALYYGSAWGLAAAALNQALVLLFNAVIEQPHVRRVHQA